MLRKRFPLSLTLVISIFFATMVIVVITCYSRRSGNTGLDMAKIYKIRHATVKNIEK